MTITLRAGDLTVQLRREGACLLSASFAGKPFLQAAAPSRAESAAPPVCFPLVPFGNRIAANRFSFAGRTYHFQPNTAGDPLYLHGDGWLARWDVKTHSADSIVLSYRHGADAASSYEYEAVQRISLQDDAMTISLSVCNRSADSMPFGIGLHPFFPKTALTRLQAPAGRFWSEIGGHLPGEAGPMPTGLDFAQAQALPDHWINNAFEDGTGRALIEWPERHLAARIEASPALAHYMLYQPTSSDFFCFEPMSHLPNGHHLPGLGGLTVLGQNEMLAGDVRISLHHLAA